MGLRKGLRKLNNEKGLPRYLSGNYYQGSPYATVAAGAALAANTIRMVPFLIREAVTISELACRTTTLSSGGRIQLAIYAHDETTGKPTGLPLAQTGSISTTTTGVTSMAPVGGNVRLEPGLYWWAINSDNSVAVMQAYIVGAAIMSYMVGGTLSEVSSAATSSTIVYSVASQTFGTWGDLTGATFTKISTANYSAPIFRVA